MNPPNEWFQYLRWPNHTNSMVPLVKFPCQAVRGGVRVICRIRPFVEDDVRALRSAVWCLWGGTTQHQKDPGYCVYCAHWMSWHMYTTPMFDVFDSCQRLLVLCLIGSVRSPLAPTAGWFRGYGGRHPTNGGTGLELNAIPPQSRNPPCINFPVNLAIWAARTGTGEGLVVPSWAQIGTIWISTFFFNRSFSSCQVFFLQVWGQGHSWFWQNGCFPRGFFLVWTSDPSGSDGMTGMAGCRKMNVVVQGGLLYLEALHQQDE